MTDDVTEVEERAARYTREVEDALADLSLADRRRLLSDLTAHLAERTDDGRPVVDLLGPPAEYADELRQAADLQPAAPSSVAVAPTPAAPASGPLRAVVVAAVAIVTLLVAVLVAVLLVGGLFALRSSDQPVLAATAPPAPVPTPAPVSVLVPDLVGMTRAEALAAVQSLGLTARVVESASDRPAGTVLATDPSTGTAVTPGSTIALTVVADAG